MTKKEKQKEKEKQMLKGDIATMEKSIAFHTARIETFGKPNPKGPFFVKLYDDVDPNHLLPYLKKSLKIMKADLKKA